VISESELEKIKKQYPSGTRIRLINMDDSQSISSGVEGTVDFVDDAGTIQMNWDNGSTLGLIPNEDQFIILSRPKIEIDNPNISI